jgi:hypothetical protein
MDWSSHKTVESRVAPGVSFVLARMSFGRRMELMKQIRELIRRVEFHEAGQDVKDRMEAAVISAEIDRLYVQWGIKEIRSLALDGAPATVQSLIEAGPEELFREALALVRGECGLSDEERKN